MTHAASTRSRGSQDTFGLTEDYVGMLLSTYCPCSCLDLLAYPSAMCPLATKCCKGHYNLNKKFRMLRTSLFFLVFYLVLWMTLLGYKGTHKHCCLIVILSWLAYHIISLLSLRYLSYHITTHSHILIISYNITTHTQILILFITTFHIHIISYHITTAHTHLLPPLIYIHILPLFLTHFSYFITTLTVPCVYVYVYWLIFTCIYSDTTSFAYKSHHHLLHTYLTIHIFLTHFVTTLTVPCVYMCMCIGCHSLFFLTCIMISSYITSPPLAYVSHHHFSRISRTTSPH